METADQSNNKPWLWKKGQSGNPSGKPKGAISMKKYVQNRLYRMTEEEKEEFVEGLPKELIWKMAEGNPKEIIDNTMDKIAEDITDDEVQVAKKIINERRVNTEGDTTSIESQGTVPESLGGEVSN